MRSSGLVFFPAGNMQLSAGERRQGLVKETGTRLPVATVIENLEDLSIEEVMEQFDVTRAGARPL